MGSSWLIIFLLLSERFWNTKRSGTRKKVRPHQRPNELNCYRKKSKTTSKFYDLRLLFNIRPCISDSTEDKYLFHSSFLFCQIFNCLLSISLSFLLFFTVMSYPIVPFIFLLGLKTKRSNKKFCHKKSRWKVKFLYSKRKRTKIGWQLDNRRENLKMLGKKPLNLETGWRSGKGILTKRWFKTVSPQMCFMICPFEFLCIMYFIMIILTFLIV